MTLSRCQDIKDEEETQPFVGGAVAVPMRRRDVWKASKSTVAAFKDDPYLEYLRADAQPIPTYRQRATQIAALLLWHRNDINFTVNGGSSITVTVPVPSTSPKTPINRLKDKLAIWLLRSQEGKLTTEQQKRWEEAGQKLTKVLGKVLPADRLAQMFYVSMVATDPQSQGRGYGSAALGAMAALADLEGRACWLLSSNTVNDIFYNSIGFETVGAFYVGDDNPAWKKAPVLAQVMVREPRTKSETIQTNLRPPMPAVAIYGPLPPFAFLI